MKQNYAHVNLMFFLIRFYVVLDIGAPLPLSSVRIAKNPRPRGYGVVVYFL